MSSGDWPALARLWLLATAGERGTLALPRTSPIAAATVLRLPGHWDLRVLAELAVMLRAVRGSLTRRRHSEMILCEYHTQDNRGYGRAQPAPATRTPASHRPTRSPISKRLDRRSLQEQRAPMREGGVSMRPRRPAWTLPVLCRCGRSPDPDALRSTELAEAGAGGVSTSAASRVRTGRGSG